MLMRFDPFRELDRLSEQMGAGPARRSFPMDAYRRGDQFIVHFDLPGVDPDSIELTVERNVVTVRAERRFELEDADEVLVSERPQGSYSRQLLLGETLDGESISADYDAGVLTLTIPVAEAAKPRRVQVGGGGAQSQSIQPETASG
jgi:HSP20 family protein